MTPYRRLLRDSARTAGKNSSSMTRPAMPNRTARKLSGVIRCSRLLGSGNPDPPAAATASSPSGGVRTVRLDTALLVEASRGAGRPGVEAEPEADTSTDGSRLVTTPTSGTESGPFGTLGEEQCDDARGATQCRCNRGSSR